MCQCSGKTDNFEFFGPNLPKNGFCDWNFKNLSLDWESAPPRYHVRQFSGKTDKLTFLAQIYRKMDFWLETQKTNVGIGISILEIPFVLIFKQKSQPGLFRPKFALNWILGLDFQKSKSGFGISTSNIPCVPIFSQNEQL